MIIEKIVSTGALASESRIAQKAASSKHGSISEDAVFLDTEEEQRQPGDGERGSHKKDEESEASEPTKIPAHAIERIPHAIHIVV